MKKIVFAGILLSALAIFGACSEKENEPQKEVQETLVTYTDIAFSRYAGNPTIGRFFSTSEGKSYTDDKVTAGNGAKIDLAFGSILGMLYFLSPDDKEIEPAIPGATATQYVQHVHEAQFTVAQFDAMTTDEPLRALTITDDNETFGASSYPIVILFQNAAGKKGVIKVKESNSERLLVDIKVQK
ncbi:MAG: hypothetical protein LBT48_08850 [Prevotellaceae bacterium]|nr:hypothetical protein [Prevotellaceae bacterium]